MQEDAAACDNLITVRYSKNENRLLPTYLSLGYTLPYHVSQFHHLSFVLSPSLCVFFFPKGEVLWGNTVCVSRHHMCSLFLLIQEEVQHREYSGIETERLVYICTVFCWFVWIRIRLEHFKLSLFACLRNRSDQILLLTRILVVELCQAVVKYRKWTGWLRATWWSALHSEDAHSSDVSVSIRWPRYGRILCLLSV